ncbi:MAG: hypothetical protein HOI66_22410, partial [Verrucomicrobia bacterium]|nr:hypothetical protein [Verrucomicrobiota bacterium]
MTTIAASVHMEEDRTSRTENWGWTSVLRVQWLKWVLPILLTLTAATNTPLAAVSEKPNVVLIYI